MDSEATKKRAGVRLVNRNAVVSFSPGLSLRLPWVRDSSNSNRKPVAPILIRRGNDATALRLNNSFARNPRVAEASNPWALGRNRVGVKSRGKAKAYIQKPNAAKGSLMCDLTKRETQFHDHGRSISKRRAHGNL